MFYELIISLRGPRGGSYTRKEYADTIEEAVATYGDIEVGSPDRVHYKDTVIRVELHHVLAAKEGTA